MAKKKYIETPEKMWAFIVGFPGYEISNLGEIRSYLKRNSKEMYLTPKYIESHVLRTHCKEYKKVSLRKDGKSQSKYVHRLVAESFIPNPQNKPLVHHINNNPLDNNAANLKWVSNSENQIERFESDGVKRLGRYIQKDRNSFRVYKKGVVSKNFKTHEEALLYSKLFY